MMISARYFSAATALLLFSAATRMSAVTLASPFGEHMVLQQGVPLPVWGSGCPGGDTVTVSVAGQNVTTRSDWAGKWKITLAPMKAGGPYQFLVRVGGNGPIIPSSAANSKGGNEVNDVLIGDVWMAAGPAVPAAGSLPNAKSAWIHVFRNSRWALAAPETLTGQAGAAWPLARGLYEAAKVPIGLVDGSYAAITPFPVRGVIWNGTAYSGPVYESMTRAGGAIRVLLRSGDGGLSTKGNSLAGFLVAGDDHKFVPATARIEGDAVVVSSPNVANPVAVHYGYAGDLPQSLCDKAGMPAGPFRTDDW